MSDLAGVTRVEARGMITLRGDLASSKIKKAIKASCGQAVPKTGQILGGGVRGVAWMSPDEVLLMVPYGEVSAILTALYKALSKKHHLAALGQFRRTRLAQVAAAIWRHETGFDVVCFRSVSDYVEGLLRNAATAKQTGAL